MLPEFPKVERLRAELQADLASGGTSPRLQNHDPLEQPLAPDARALRERVIEVLKTVYDPEIPVNIVDLGLVYDIEVTDSSAVRVRMTLTTPACPVAGTLPGEIQRKLQAVPGVNSAEVELVWDPPWDRSRMSDEALLELGLL
ncbi:MAG: SUF system Fe-S cluster assembly protein [Phycisphaerae bacterium]|nr:SUF system Fe-S cluster assembly protein [Phycisphaerae bacterium]MDW8261472.1 SUF system Fe-S cluster assembly protein [Phycisphaerales bacterium]